MLKLISFIVNPLIVIAGISGVIFFTAVLISYVRAGCPF